MHEIFWNSPTEVICLENGAAASSTAFGKLHEMVEHLLSLPADLRNSLRLVSDAFERPLGPAEAAALRGRSDFPLIF